MGSVKLHFTISFRGKCTQSDVHVKHVTNHENRHFIYYWFLLYGHVSKGLETNKFKNLILDRGLDFPSVAGTDLIAFGLYWRPRSRFSHTDLPLG